MTKTIHIPYVQVPVGASYTWKGERFMKVAKGGVIYMLDNLGNWRTEPKALLSARVETADRRKAGSPSSDAIR